MKNIFIGMLIITMLTAVSNAAVIPNVTVTASDEYQTVLDPYMREQVDGAAVNAVNGTGFEEKTGFHYNDGAFRGYYVTKYDADVSLDDDFVEGDIRGGNMWIASFDPANPNNTWIEFDLGQNQTLTRIKVWNANSAYMQILDFENPICIDRLGMGIQQMDIILMNAAGSTLAAVSNYSIDKAPGKNEEDFGQEIDLTGVYTGSDVRRVKFVIDATYGDAPANKVALSEVRFYNNLPDLSVDAGLDRIVTMTNNSPAPNGATFDLDGTVTVGTAVSTVWYEWPDGEPNIIFVDPDTVLDPTVTIQGPGTYYFTLVAENSSGVIASDTVKVQALNVGDDGLIAHWDFEEGSGTTADDAVADHGLTLDLAKVEWSTDAAVGTGALSALGTGVLNDPNTNNPYFNSRISNGDFSNSMWIKPIASNDEYECLIDGGCWQLWQTGDRLRFMFSLTYGPAYGQRYSTEANPTNIYDGQWHFVVVTYDRYIAKLYIDSRLEAQLQTTSDSYYGLGRPLTPVGQIWLLGSSLNQYYYNGLIDDLKLYNICLPQDHIVTEYLLGNNPIEPVCASLDLLETDINGDCQVDITDLQLWVENWLN